MGNFILKMRVKFYTGIAMTVLAAECVNASSLETEASSHDLMSTDEQKSYELV